jgi:hypothetical protein
MKKAALITLLTLSLLTLISFIGDNKTESIEINKKLLNELYYENENDAFFYSSNTYDVVTNQINLYAINWLTKMNDIINVNYSEKFTSYIDKYYTSNDLNLSIKNKIDLINFNNMLSVRKFFFGNIEEKSYYIDILRNACTEEQWLYLQSDNFEDKVFKTQVLYLALQNFDVLEQIPDIIKSNMIVYLKSFLNNPEYFNVHSKELKRNLIDFEIIILQSLILLDKYTDENLIDLVKTKEIWLIQQVDNLNKELETTNGTTNMIFLNDCILNLNQVLLSAEINKSFNQKYAENFDFKLISEVYLMDAQITYKSLKVCQILDKAIDKKINNFINENINYWIFKETPVSNLKELYYSIKLAHIYDINYNDKKIINFINKFEKSTNLQDIYFNYLLKKELSLPFISDEITLRAIAENIRNFDSISLEQKFYLIYLCKELGLTSEYFDDIIIKMNQQNIKSKMLNANSDSDLYYLSKIANALNIKLDLNFINEEVEKYKFSEGGFCIEKNGDSPNTMSTYRMIELKKDYGIQLNDEELSGISTFISKVKGAKGGYYYNLSNPSDMYNYYNNFSFVSFYYGEVLNSMIE